MKRTLIAITVIIIAGVIFNQMRSKVTPDQKEPQMDDTINNEEQVEQRVVISTNKGSITLALYPQHAPQTVRNFLEKVSSDYYRELTFHRVEDWVVQGGDPLGTGTGGGKMPTELNELPFVVGALGVARGPDISVSNDSQFFIVKTDAHHLDGQYTNFGQVVEGMDVVNALSIGDTIISIELD